MKNQKVSDRCVGIDVRHSPMVYFQKPIDHQLLDFTVLESHLPTLNSVEHILFLIAILATNCKQTYTLLEFPFKMFVDPKKCSLF